MVWNLGDSVRFCGILDKTWGGRGKGMGDMAFCAEEYDAKIRQTLPFYEEFYEQVVGIVEVWGRKELSWLDIGCGTLGLSSIFIRSRLIYTVRVLLSI